MSARKRTTTVAAKPAATKPAATAESKPTEDAKPPVETVTEVKPPEEVKPPVEAPPEDAKPPLTVVYPVTEKTDVAPLFGVSIAAPKPAADPSFAVSDRAMNHVRLSLLPHFGQEGVTDELLVTVRAALEAGRTVVALRHPFEVLVTDDEFSRANVLNVDYRARYGKRMLLNLSAALLSAKIYGG